MKLDANEIAPNLWQGSFPPTGNYISLAGFRVLVLCARERQLSAECFPGVQVIHAPNDDHSAFPLNREKLAVALDAAHQVAEAVRLGMKCLVTCKAGLNRSGLVSALSLHLLYGWPGIKCVAQVRKMRPYSPVHAMGVGALANGEFVRALSHLGGPSPSVPQ